MDKREFEKWLETTIEEMDDKLNHREYIEDKCYLKGYKEALDNIKTMVGYGRFDKK